MSDSNMRTPIYEFGATHIVEPTLEHSHTIVLLHGRGSSGPDFYNELSSTSISPDGSSTSMFGHLPGFRFVLPSAFTRFCPTFQEEICEWFDISSLTDVDSNNYTQLPGILASIKHLDSVIKEEVNILQGDSSKLFIGGISQGAAIGYLIVLKKLLANHEIGGAWFVNGWMPFSRAVECALGVCDSKTQDQGTTSYQMSSSEERMVDYLFSTCDSHSSVRKLSGAALETAIFIGHGTDDAYVDIIDGSRAYNVLTRLNFTSLQWREYTGADLEGHWFKEPEEMDDITTFLRRSAGLEY